MKAIILILTLVSSNAFAMQLNCVKRINENRVEGTNIHSWPEVYITRGFQECYGESCRAGVLDQIVNNYSVCFREVDFQKDCEVVDSGDYATGFVMHINCNNSVTASFIMNQSKQGRVSCIEKGELKRSWHVGICEEQ